MPPRPADALIEAPGAPHFSHSVLVPKGWRARMCNSTRKSQGVLKTLWQVRGISPHDRFPFLQCSNADPCIFCVLSLPFALQTSGTFRNCTRRKDQRSVPSRFCMTRKPSALSTMKALTLCACLTFPSMTYRALMWHWTCALRSFGRALSGSIPGFTPTSTMERKSTFYFTSPLL